MARAFAELMRRLGYQRYGAQGGDFGAFVAPDLGRVDPEHDDRQSTSTRPPWGSSRSAT